MIETPVQHRLTHKRLFALLNHQLTDLQRNDALQSKGVTEIVFMSPDMQALWRQVPADLETIAEYLAPLMDWLAEVGREGDYALIQGDFGATWLMVQQAFALGLVPVYSTTERQAEETVSEDGAVRLVHTFRHRRFRVYGR